MLGRTEPRAGGRGCKFGDSADAAGMVVALDQQRLPGGRAQRSGVKAVVFDALCREPFERRRLTRAAERAGGPKAHVVDHDDQNILRAFRGPQVADRRERRVGVRGVPGCQSDMGLIGNGRDVARYGFVRRQCDAPEVALFFTGVRSGANLGPVSATFLRILMPR